MTAPSDEISRLRRELETAFDVAREIGEERNELAAALGREAAMTQRLRAALHEIESTALYTAGSLPAKCQWCGWISGRHDEECPVTIARAALASDNNGSNDGTG